jgi:transposase
LRAASAPGGQRLPRRANGIICGSNLPRFGFAGNRCKARRVMVELAWLWLRYQPDSSLSVWFRERVGKLKGRIRRITIVAVARRLLIALWRYLETGLVPEGAAFKV